MSDKRRRIILDIWIEDRELVNELVKKIEQALLDTVMVKATRWKMDIDLFAFERPLIGDKDRRY